MSGLREANRSLRADFLQGVQIELHAWLDADGPDREHVHRMLHRWIGTGGTIGLGELSQLARGLRARTLSGESWGSLRPGCEELLEVTRRHMTDPVAPVPRSTSVAEVVLRVAEPGLRARVTLELASLRPAPRLVEESASGRALVVWDGAGTAALEEFLAQHAALPVEARPRVLVLCEPGVVPGWIAHHARRDVQFLIGLSDGAHLRETLVASLWEGHGA